MVASIWPIFMLRYPSAVACSSASQEELFELLVPLGFGNQRVEAIRSMATTLNVRHGGKVPRSIEHLVALPHLGLYSAHAIACFAYNRRVPVVDVNVLRLFSRLTGEDYGLDNRRGRAPEAWEMARRVLPRRGVKEHNYGLLDFCAQVCTSRHPLHSACPLASRCAVYATSQSGTKELLVP
jgi:A/G-specific adenine glycosylase